MEDIDIVDEAQVAKNKAQMEYNMQAGKPIYPAGQLAMFEKGDKTKTRRGRNEEDSSDEEELGQLVCNMTGSKWESLPNGREAKGVLRRQMETTTR